MARPTKYSEDVAKEIAEGIKLGLTYDLAAQLGGISEDTFSRWRKRYADFADRIAKAEALGARSCLARIHKESQEGDWRAAAWILEHRHPHQYGKQVSEHQLTGKDGEPPVFRFEIVPSRSDGGGA